MQRTCVNLLRDCQRTRCFSSTTFTMARRQVKHPKLPVPSGVVPKVTVPEDHALWGFFRKTRETMTGPELEAKHGRAWTAEELRNKSFEDLHALWIICLKERNIIATQAHERRRQQIGDSGDKQAKTRELTVRRTMARIKFVLSERFIAYQEALELAAQDDLIDPKPSALPKKVSKQNKVATVPNPASQKTVNSAEAANLGATPSSSGKEVPVAA